MANPLLNNPILNSAHVLSPYIASASTTQVVQPDIYFPEDRAKDAAIKKEQERQELLACRPSIKADTRTSEQKAQASTKTKYREKWNIGTPEERSRWKQNDQTATEIENEYIKPLATTIGGATLTAVNPLAGTLYYGTLSAPSVYHNPVLHGEAGSVDDYKNLALASTLLLPIKIGKVPTKPAVSTRPISFAERMGIPRGDRGNLSLNQKQALGDLQQYIESGQHRQVFRMTPDGKSFGWEGKNSTNPTFVQKAVESGIPQESIVMRLPVKSATGKGVVSYIPEINSAGYRSEAFSTPFGEAVLTGSGGLADYIKLTSPRVDALTGYNPLPGPALKKLPDTINKDIMRDFWINARKTSRPGSYISGDYDRAPLGSFLISAYKKRQLYKVPVQERPLAQQEVIRKGLSPDSYSSIIRQGNRDNSLRWGEGFSRWNDAAVTNRRIYDAWQQFQNKEITGPQYEQIFNDWSKSIGGRPLQWGRDSQGNTIPVHPHPYIYQRRFGGKF